MRLLLERPGVGTPVSEVDGRGAERQTGGGERVREPAGVDLAEADMKQLGERYEPDLLEMPRVFWEWGLFTVNPKIVPACTGAKLRLPLIKEDIMPDAARQRRYSPEQETMIQSEFVKQFNAGAIRGSSSTWVANCLVVRKKGGIARVCQNYRDLNTLLNRTVEASETSKSSSTA